MVNLKILLLEHAILVIKQVLLIREQSKYILLSMTDIIKLKLGELKVETQDIYIILIIQILEDMVVIHLVRYILKKEINFI